MDKIFLLRGILFQLALEHFRRRASADVLLVELR